MSFKTIYPKKFILEKPIICFDVYRSTTQENKSLPKEKNGKWIIVYAEAYRNKKDASIREKKLKQHSVTRGSCLIE